MRATTLLGIASLLVWAACGSVDPGFKGTITLEEATSSTAVTGVSCKDANGYVGETSYFRAFRLADYKIQGAFRVTAVSFAVSERVIGTGFVKFPIDVSVHDYTGEVGSDTIDTAKMALKKASTVDIVATNPTVMVVKYDQPMTAEIEEDALVFKIHVANYTAQMHKFFLAVSNQGERQPSYSACGSAAPKTLTGLGFPMQSLLMSVTGESY
jgi:hypothetical protein